VNIIGIETSAGLCSAAVLSTGGAPVEETETSANVFTERLFSLVRAALERAGIEMRLIDGVAVSTGPGSFTGIRVGVSSAKGIAHSLNIPVSGVTAYEAMAFGVDADCFPLCCVVPFKRDELSYVLCSSADDPALMSAGAAGTWDELASRLSEISCITGQIADNRVRHLRNRLPAQGRILPFTPSGAAVARAGLRKMERGVYDNAAALSPLYAHSMKFREKRSKFS